HAQEFGFRRPGPARLFPRAPAAGAARLRLRARLRQAPREDARCPAGRAESARIQMRRAMGHAGCALSCLCGAEAYSARRLRAAGLERRLSDPSAVIPAEARPRLPRGVRLVSSETATEMRFAAFIPPQADQHPVPVVWYLSGLTCTEENFTVKAGAYASVSAFSPICSPMNCPWGEKALSGYLGGNKERWRRY